MEGPNAEPANPHVGEEFDDAIAHKNGGAGSGEACLVRANTVRHARDEDAGLTCGVTARAVDEDALIELVQETRRQPRPELSHGSG